MITEKIKREIIEHAAECSPRECCGLIIIKKGKSYYIKCRNIAENGIDFAIHPEDFANAEDQGKIVMVVHSHPLSNPKPSPADLIGCERSGVEWLIIAGLTKEIHTFKPTGYVTPLIGREFKHGILDCYSFIQDYYHQNLDIILQDYERQQNWWLSGESLYLDNLSDLGFTEVSELKKHDMILMKIKSPVPNHAAIYVGDGKIEHHQSLRLSSRDVYGGWYQKVTTHFMRYKAFH